MGLMRSLFAGVSGLRNHQLYMDVIGNNIANVSTHGFKAGRVGFSEIFAQTLKGTTQPVSNRGGTNPIQVGLGMSVTTIDTIFSQGNIESTGQTTDLAIQGDGFFVVSDGNQRFYTRNGGFQFNANDTLVLPGSGMKLQGYLADDDGEIPAGTPITDLTLPVNRKIAANPTTMVELAGNLDTSAEPLGTILESDGLFAIEEAGDGSDINGLFANGAANGIVSGMIAGSTNVEISDGSGNSESYLYVESDSGIDGAFNSLDDLIAEINNDFGAAGFNTIQASLLSATGQLQLTDLSGAANDVSVNSTNPVLDDALLSLNGDIFAGALTSDEFSHVAGADDLLGQLRDDNGQSLGLGATDIITISGTVGGNAVTPGTLTVTATDTYQDLATLIESTLNLGEDSGVEISDDDGRILITGDGGTAYEITNFGISATDTTGTIPRTIFDGILDATTGNWDETQEAEDVEQSVTVTVYDSQGNNLDLTLIFTEDVQQPNHWTWEVQLDDPAVVTGGSTGTVSFNEDGSLLRFIYDDGSSSVTLDPGTDAGTLSVELDIGDTDGFDGITQMSGVNASTLIGTQDGYGMGILNLISIDEMGRLTGTFSNGIVQLLGQVVMAKFPNSGGLLRANDNLFQLSGNSGDPMLTTAGDGLNTTIVSGALEQSNVDLAEEFTKMIIAQRAFQANARTITVSDDMLSEVTNLKR